MRVNNGSAPPVANFSKAISRRTPSSPLAVSSVVFDNSDASENKLEFSPASIRRSSATGVIAELESSVIFDEQERDKLGSLNDLPDFPREETAENETSTSNSSMSAKSSESMTSPRISITVGDHDGDMMHRSDSNSLTSLLESEIDEYQQFSANQANISNATTETPKVSFGSQEIVTTEKPSRGPSIGSLNSDAVTVKSYHSLAPERSIIENELSPTKSSGDIASLTRVVDDLADVIEAAKKLNAKKVLILERRKQRINDLKWEIAQEKLRYYQMVDRQNLLKQAEEEGAAFWLTLAEYVNRQQADDQHNARLNASIKEVTETVLMEIQQAELRDSQSPTAVGSLTDLNSDQLTMSLDRSRRKSLASAADADKSLGRSKQGSGTMRSNNEMYDDILDGYDNISESASKESGDSVEA